MSLHYRPLLHPPSPPDPPPLQIFVYIRRGTLTPLTASAFCRGGQASCSSPHASPPQDINIYPIFNLGVLLRNAKSETKDVGAVDEFPLNLVDHVTNAAGGSSASALQLIKLAEKGEACGKTVSERNGDPADPAVNCMDELRKVTVVEDMLQVGAGRGRGAAQGGQRGRAAARSPFALTPPSQRRRPFPCRCCCSPTAA